MESGLHIMDISLFIRPADADAIFDLFCFVLFCLLCSSSLGARRLILREDQLINSNQGLWDATESY